MEIPPLSRASSASAGTAKPAVTAASLISTTPMQKVRSTRASRLREEQQQLKAAAIAAVGTAGGVSHRMSGSSRSSAATSPVHGPKDGPIHPHVPPIKLTPPNKISMRPNKSGMVGTLRQPITPPIGGATNNHTQHTTPPRHPRHLPPPPTNLVVLSDSDPSPASSIKSRGGGGSMLNHEAPSTSSTTPSTTTTTPTPISGSLFSIPPQSNASPRLTSQSMSILHLATRPVGVSAPSSTLSSRPTLSSSTRLGRMKAEVKAAQLSSAQRSVLEDIHIISDWLTTVQQSEPQHLLQFRNVISRMKKTIFMPAQVRRARAQMKNGTNGTTRGVTGGRTITSTTAPSSNSIRTRSIQHTVTTTPAVATGTTIHPSPTQAQQSTTSRAPSHHTLTGVNIHLDLSSVYDPSAVDDSDYGGGRTSPSRCGVDDGDDSDYDELDGDDNSDFDTKLTSFIRKTTKCDEDVLKGKGNTGGYHHAPGVAFENGRWVPKDVSAYGGETLSDHLSDDRLHSSSDGPSSHRDLALHGSVGGVSDIDDIPDFSQTTPSASEEAYSSPSHTYMNEHGGGRYSSPAVNYMHSSAQFGGGRMRSSSNSYSVASTASYGVGGYGTGKRSSGTSRGGGSSVSAAASPGFDDSDDVSVSMRSESPSLSVTSMAGVGVSQSVFSHADRTRHAASSSISHSHDEFDEIDAIPDFGSEPPQSVTPIAGVRPNSATHVTTKASGPASPATATIASNLAPFPFATNVTPASTAPSIAPHDVTNSTDVSGSLFTPAPLSAHSDPPSVPVAAPAGPTLITMQSWSALGRPTSLDQDAAAAVKPDPTQNTHAPNDGRLFMKTQMKDEFPDEIDFDDDDDDDDVAQPILPSSHKDRSIDNVVPMSQPTPTSSLINFMNPTPSSSTTTSTTTGHRSKLHNFTTLPPNMKFSITTPSSRASTIQTIQSEEDGFEDDFGAFDTDDGIDSSSMSVSSVGVVGSVSTPSHPNLHVPPPPTSLERIAVPILPTGGKKIFSQRTLVKKKTKVEDEFPSDLDNLSDADFSDEERGGGSGGTLSSPAHTLGPATRSLNEFDLTDLLQANLNASELSHSTIFEGGLDQIAHSKHIHQRLYQLIKQDGMTIEIRNEFIQTNLNIDLILALNQTSTTNSPPTTTTATSTASSMNVVAASNTASSSIAPKHTRKSASAHILSPTHTHPLPPRVPVSKSPPPTISPAHQRGKSTPHDGR